MLVAAAVCHSSNRPDLSEPAGFSSAETTRVPVRVQGTKKKQ